MITVSNTEHFSIQYDESKTPRSDGQRLGTAIQQTCEQDYSTLKKVFGEIDPPNPIKVTVDLGCGGRQDRHDVTHDGDCGGGSSGDFDYLRNSFVAELAELFMLKHNRKWNPSDSKGESLSRVMGGWLYPGGQQPFFTVHQWVDNLRDDLTSSEDVPTGLIGLEDWVTKVDNNDTRAKSIGCGVAFLHYLHYQLGFSFEEIVSKEGDVLEDLYQQLTGDSNGFQPFAVLVRKAFPQGSPSGLNENAKFPYSDQIFPLLTTPPTVFAIKTRQDDGSCTLFVPGLDGKIWSNFWPSPNNPGQWSGWFPVGDNTFPAGAPVTAIKTRQDDGSCTLFVPGLDGKIWSNFWPSPNNPGQWSGWFPVGDKPFMV
jgi:hypothetical protein